MEVAMALEKVLYFSHLKKEVAKMGEGKQAGKGIAVGLAIVAGIYILSKILTPKKEVSAFYCPNCQHIVSDHAPYCWHCRIPLNWQSSPIKATLKRAPTLVFLAIVLFLAIMRYAVYPFTNVSPDTCVAADRGLWFFGGIFIRDFGGYFGRTVK